MLAAADRRQVAQLAGQPPLDVLLAHRVAQAPRPRASLVGGHEQRAFQLVGRPGNVGRRDDQRIGGQLLCRSGRFGEQKNWIPFADQHGLLGHEVHAVDHRIDHHDIGQTKRGDRHRVVGPVVDPDRLIVGLREAVDPRDDFAYRCRIVRVLRD